jgi:hypothetical protein
MGYRSQVFIAIDAVAITKAKLQGLVNDKPLTDCFDDNPPVNSTSTEGVPVLVYQLQDVKWYPNYSDVIAVHNFLNELAKLDIDYEFYRIGEEEPDIDRQGHGDLYVAEIETVIGFPEE